MTSLLKRARHDDEYKDPFTDSLQDEDAMEDSLETTFEASKALRKFLISLWTNGKLDAAVITELSYHISESKGEGVKDLAVHPSSASKHGSGHLKMVLGKTYQRPVEYNVTTPIYDKILCRRTTHSMPVRLPTQCLCEDILDDASSSSLDADNCPHAKTESYTNHPVVRKAQQKGVHWSKIIPVALYFDGVQYSKRDSFLGFFTRNLRSSESHLNAIIRDQPRY